MSLNQLLITLSQPKRPSEELLKQAHSYRFKARSRLEAYNAEAIKCQRFNLYFNLVVLISVSCIGVNQIINYLHSSNNYQLTVIVLSIVAALSSALAQLLKFQETSLNYKKASAKFGMNCNQFNTFILKHEPDWTKSPRVKRPEISEEEKKMNYQITLDEYQIITTEYHKIVKEAPTVSTKILDKHRRRLRKKSQLSYSYS